MPTMLVPVIPIGDSKGIRFPKDILNDLNIENELEMRIYNDEIILKRIEPTPRAGWEAAFMEMHNAGEDKLICPELSEDCLFEWEW